MQVGRMRYRIEIQDYKSTQDADGFETREWMTVHTVWADIAPVSGKEYMASNKETAEITNKIYIRFRSCNSQYSVNYFRKCISCYFKILET